MQELNKWTTTYYKWLKQKGKPINVKPLRFVGVFSKRGHVYHRTDLDGNIYCAEIYECLLEDGSIKKMAFKTPYNKNYKNKNYFKNKIYIDDLNYLNDYINMETQKQIQKPNFLLILENNKLRSKIKRLENEFKNSYNTDLKIGIQIFLERFQSPCILTMKNLKKYKKENPENYEYILNL